MNKKALDIIKELASEPFDMTDDTDKDLCFAIEESLFSEGVEFHTFFNPVTNLKRFEIK